MQSKRFLNAEEKVRPEAKRFIEKNLDLIEQINEILNLKGWSQKDFAQKLGKSESEISKWLSGLHNFTLQTISKIEAAFEQDIVVTPKSTVKLQHIDFESDNNFRSMYLTGYLDRPETTFHMASFKKSGGHYIKALNIGDTGINILDPMQKIIEIRGYHHKMHINNLVLKEDRLEGLRSFIEMDEQHTEWNLQPSKKRTNEISREIG